jgi:hypothetical protein
MERKPPHPTSANASQKTTPFRVPEGYFDGLTGAIIDRTASVSKAEDRIQPASFSVPANYFQQLPGRVSRRIPEGRVISIRPVVRWSVAAVLMVGFLLYRGLSVQSAPTQLTENEPLSIEEIQSSYVMDDLDEAFLTETLLSSTSEASTSSDEDLKNYLIDNGIDLSQTDIEL